MNADLQELRITPKELETLTGLEINELFIGGLLGGVYRPSLFKQPDRWLSFCFTEVAVLGLMAIFSLPLGLVAIRHTPAAIDNTASSLPFVWVTLTLTVLGMAAWHLYMVLRFRQLRSLAHLLDEVDRYHETLVAVDLLDQLDQARTIGQSSTPSLNWAEVLEVLRMTRESLVCGLMTEKTLRTNRSLLARRTELLTTIEGNLAVLRSLEVQHQASEQGRLIQEALEISLSVQRELRQP